MDSAASERWWFVVGGEPGLALAFFFGDEFCSLTAFLVDAVAAGLVRGFVCGAASSPRAAASPRQCP
jgi:hypothetical protein